MQVTGPRICGMNGEIVGILGCNGFFVNTSLPEVVFKFVSVVSRVA